MTDRTISSQAALSQCTATDGEFVAVDACRSLWCAVLVGAWREAFSTSPKATRKDLAAARRWFGSGDFHTVCALAGFDGDHILGGFEAALRGDRPVDAIFNPRGTGPVQKGRVAA
ncbi:hypothetical protein PAF17_10455 [Paracoccus sp. Z330]|uniref:DUF982 domain-containing protein n=1 Tax=Paracoccus onchidii TaxID=3017813 RepID=A0ABT4ZF28_9RHOB|nr:hypothetical protein [Paracoccus onchidii]MDB6177921.1 hypothetical protein [Paracoccus onchidii]